MKNKKAQSVFNIYKLMIIALLVVLFFGGLIYIMGKINDVFLEVGLNNEQYAGGETYVNLTQASESTIGKLNDSIQSLRIVAFAYIIGLAVSIILTNAMMKLNPIWFFAYIVISVLAVIFAPTISNAYEDILLGGAFDGIYNTFTTSNYFILNLPVFIMVVGLLGGIFLFINFLRLGNETMIR